MELPFLSNPGQPASRMVHEAEETLVQEKRADLRPAQMVDIKLSELMRGPFYLVSQLRSKELIGHR